MCNFLSPHEKRLLKKLQITSSVFGDDNYALIVRAAWEAQAQSQEMQGPRKTPFAKSWLL